MNILSINNKGKEFDKKDATFYYRWSVPAKYLRRIGDKCYQLPLKNKNNDTPFDVVIFNKFYGTDVSKMIEAIRETKGSKIIYETDDLQWNPDKSLPFYSDLKTVGMDEIVSTFSQLLAQQADACTCTTEPLKAELEKITNKPVYVVPNSIDLEEWLPREGGNKRLRIGFVGAPNHWPHLRILLKVIKRLKRFYEFDFIMKGTFLKQNFEDGRKLGQTTTAFYQSIVECEKLARGIDIIEAGWSDNHDFAKDVRDLNLDIGICMLDETPFNVCRSALKFYQYAACKTATIASDTVVYKECNFTVRNDEEAWYKGLQALITNEELRNKITAEQRAWVIGNRSAEVVAKIWQNTFLDILHA